MCKILWRTLMAIFPSMILWIGKRVANKTDFRTSDDKRIYSNIRVVSGRRTHPSLHRKQPSK